MLTHAHAHTVYLEAEIPKEQYLVEKNVHKQLWPNDDLISLFDFSVMLPFKETWREVANFKV